MSLLSQERLESRAFLTPWDGLEFYFVSDNRVETGFEVSTERKDLMCVIDPWIYYIFIVYGT